jgi:hypothetical protein
MRSRTSLAVVFALSFVASAAHADDKSDAARLFKEGQELMKAQRYADACPKLEDSQKLDPQIGTVLNLGFCREKLGSTWLSWLAYRDAELRADAAGKRERVEFARQHLAELEKSLPRLVLDCGSDKIDDLAVEGRVVPGANNGQPFTAESGKRTFKFTKGGKKPASIEVLVTKQSSPQRIACPELVDEPVATPPTPIEGGGSGDGHGGGDTAPPPPPSQPSRVPMYVSFAVGGAGLVFGGVFTALMLSKKSEADLHCPLQKCDAVGTPLIKEAKDDGWIATGGYAVGLVGLAAGAYFLFTTPSAPADTAAPKAALVPMLGGGASGAAVVGRF